MPSEIHVVCGKKRPEFRWGGKEGPPADRGPTDNHQLPAVLDKLLAVGCRQGHNSRCRNLNIQTSTDNSAGFATKMHVLWILNFEILKFCNLVILQFFILFILKF